MRSCLASASERRLAWLKKDLQFRTSAAAWYRRTKATLGASK